MSDVRRVLLFFIPACCILYMIAEMNQTSNILAEANKNWDREQAVQKDRDLSYGPGFDNVPGSSNYGLSANEEAKFKMGDPSLNPSSSEE